VTGLRQSVKGFQNSVTGVTPQDVLELMLVTQYYDMLREVRRCLGLGAGTIVRSNQLRS
jgi:hypothetical protein